MKPLWGFKSVKVLNVHVIMLGAYLEIEKPATDLQLVESIA